MKRRHISLLIIFILALAVIYFWNEKHKESNSYHTIYLTQLSKDIEFLTTALLLSSIPDTFNMYSNELTEAELSLFNNSLQIINRDISVALANIKKIEDIDHRGNALSKSIEELNQLFFTIQEDAQK